MEICESPLLTVRPNDSAIIAVLEARSLGLGAADDLHVQLRTAAATDPSKPVIFDISRLEFAPSAGIGALVGFMGELIIERRRLLLVGAGERVRRVLAVTRVDSLLQLFSTVEAALESLGLGK